MPEDPLDLAQKQQNWLQYLQTFTKKEIQVAWNTHEGGIGPWIGLQSARQFPVDNRTVLPFEIIIDIDDSKWERVTHWANKIIRELRNSGIPYILSYSGGRGCHIHIFLQIDPDQLTEASKAGITTRDIRGWFFHRILDEANIPKDIRGKGEIFDTACVDWNDERSGHLVREFGGIKERMVVGHKTVIEDIPDKKPKITQNDVLFPDKIIWWRVPRDLFETLIKDYKAKQTEEAREEYQRAIEAVKNYAGKYLNLPCVELALKGLPVGKRNLGAQVIAIAAKLDQLDKPAALKIARDYYNACPREDLGISEINSWVEWIYADTEPFWNCKLANDLGLCNKDACKLEKGKYKEELELLKNPDLLAIISEDMRKTIVLDDDLKVVVLFTGLSAYGANPINLFLKGPTSSGKSYVVVQVMQYFPKRDVWLIGGLSKTAFVHDLGAIEEINGQPYIIVNLTGKILVFLEAPKPEVLDMLKPIMSHDVPEIMFRVTDKGQNGKLQTKRVIIRGWPVFIFCSADSRMLDEISTRNLLYAPSTDFNKVSQVLDRQAQKAEKPWEYMIKNQMQKRIARGIELLKVKPKNVAIPLASKLEKPKSADPRVMRDYPKALELTKMCAWLHSYQRSVVSISVNNIPTEFLIAADLDILIGQHLYRTLKQSTESGLPPVVIHFFNKVILPLCCADSDTPIHGASTTNMKKKHLEVYGKPIGNNTLTQHRLKPLEDTGFLDAKTDPVDKRCNEYFIVKSLNEEKLSTNNSNFNLVDILNLNSLKEWLLKLENYTHSNVSQQGVNAKIDEIIANTLKGENTLCIFSKVFKKELIDKQAESNPNSKKGEFVDNSFGDTNTNTVRSSSHQPPQFRKARESFEGLCDYCGEKRWLDLKDDEGNRVCGPCSRIDLPEELNKQRDDSFQYTEPKSKPESQAPVESIESRVKQSGREWESVYDKPVISNLTTFSLWYCENRDSTKVPSEISAIAENVFKIISDNNNGNQSKQEKGGLKDQYEIDDEKSLGSIKIAGKEYPVVEE